MKKIMAFMLSIILIMAFTLQVGAIQNIKLTSIKVDKSKIALKVGQTSKLNVTFIPANTSQKILTYATSDKNIATVDDTGTITAVKAGKTVITVISSSNNKILTKCDVTVSQVSAKITFAYTAGDPLFKQVISDRVMKFNAKNPSMKIIERASAGSASWLQQLKVLDAVGEFPDMVESRETNVWVDAGRLAPLPEELTSLVENPIKFNGKVYAVPYSFPAPNGIFYNVKMFKDNGLSEPKTYGDFLKICDTLKSKKINPLVIGAKDLFHMGFWWSKFWIDDVFSKDTNWITNRYLGKVKFSDDNVKGALQKYLDLIGKGYVEPGYMSTPDNQITSILVSGKAAMFYSGSHMFQQIMDADKNFEFGWFAIPDEAGKINVQGGLSLGGWSYSVNCAKDPNKTAIANAWIKAFFEKDTYTDYLKKMGQFPSTKEKLTVKYSISAFQKLLDVANKADYKDLNWNQKWGTNTLPNAGGFRNWAYKALEEAMISGASAADLCKKLDTEWDIETKDNNPTVKK